MNFVRFVLFNLLVGILLSPVGAVGGAVGEIDSTSLACINTGSEIVNQLKYFKEKKPKKEGEKKVHFCFDKKWVKTFVKLKFNFVS